MELEEALQNLILSYYNHYQDMQQVPINIILTDDINKKHCELYPERTSEIMSAAREIDHNGRMVPAPSLEEPMNILMNTIKMLQYTKDGSMTWIGTFAHELTHAIDYYQMARLLKLKDYSSLEYTKHNQMFQMWSEYHARKKGYGFLRKFLADCNCLPGSTEQIEYILKTEWPTHKEQHFIDYHNNANGSNQMYITMQLLGRYSVWNDCFPSVFNLDALKKEYNGEAWMYKLYEFLRQHERLENTYNCFEELKLIFRLNWPI